LDGALANYTKAIQLRPDYARAYYNRGLVKFNKNDLEGALADFTKAIELNPIWLKHSTNAALSRKLGRHK